MNDESVSNGISFNRTVADSILGLILVVLTFAACMPARAESAAAAVDGWTFFGSQHFWMATQDAKLLDAAVLTSGVPGSAPVVELRLAPTVASALIPITSLGARWRDVVATGSFQPAINFNGGAASGGGQLARKEYDLSLGYAISPTMTAAVIYKHANFAPSETLRASQLIGGSVSESGQGLLMGLSGSAPMSASVSMYGSLAYGGGRVELKNLPAIANIKSRYSVRYTVAEFGLAWHLVDATSSALVNGVTLQLGYRAQVIDLRGVELQSFTAAASPQILSTRSENAPNTTQGLVISVGVAF